jgi:hypothetical protein
VVIMSLNKMTRKSNEEMTSGLDEILASKSIKRMGEYVSTQTKIGMLCLVCEHSWNGKPAGILYSDTGCPSCNKSIRLTNEEVDRRLVGRNIKRLDAIINAHTKIRFQCEIDDRIWVAVPSMVISKTGCPTCAGLEKLTNEIIDERLIGRNIIRLGQYDGNKIPFECQCLKCQHVWMANSNNLFSSNSGCPDCAGLAPLSNAEIDIKLEGRNIKRIDDYKNNHTPMLFRCLVDQCEWITVSKSIIINGTGCPVCGLNKNQKLIGSVLAEHGVAFEQEKYARDIFTNMDDKDRKSIDYYILQANAIIEYNGIQHYQPTKFGDVSDKVAKDKFIRQQARDAWLQKQCDDSGVRIIWIDGRKYKEDNLKQYMINEIIPTLSI